MEERNVEDATIVDFVDNCYIIESADGLRYKLPEGCGAYTEIENNRIIQVDEDHFIRLNIPADDENSELVENDGFVQMIVDEVCWKSPRQQTTNDINATISLLELKSSDKFEKLFNDKKSVKIKIWQMIAKEMCNLGFKVGEGKEGAERCRQKYHNLLKSYLQLTKHSKTGTEGKPFPKYFDLMHKLFGNKHNVNPTFLVDSLTGVDDKIVDNTNAVEEAKEQSLEVTTPINTSRASTLVPSRIEGKKLKPKCNSEKILEVIQNQHQQQMESNQKHFETIEKLLIEQNKYKQEFLSVFKTMVNVNSKKRKTASDSE